MIVDGNKSYFLVRFVENLFQGVGQFRCTYHFPNLLCLLFVWFAVLILDTIGCQSFVGHTVQWLLLCSDITDITFSANHAAFLFERSKNTSCHFCMAVDWDSGLTWSTYIWGWQTQHQALTFCKHYCFSSF